MSDKKSTPGAGSPPPSGASKAVQSAGGAKAAAGPAGAEPAAGPAADTSPDAAAAGPGLPDLEAHAEAPVWLSGDEGHDSHLWDDAFDAGSGEADSASAAEPVADAAAEPTVDAAAASAAEPVLTDPDSVTLETPSLAKADISSEAAEAASLGDATAEVKAVEAEAADASVLTDPASNHPAARNHTEGIAAAAPMTEEDQSPATGAAEETSAAADGPESAADPAAGTGPDSEAAPEASGAAESTPSRRSRRTSEAKAPSAAEGNGRNKRLLLIIGVLGVLAVLLILLFTVLGSSNNEPGVLDKNVAPVDLEAGACLQDFSGVNEPATVVTCETPHNAQLVATVSYPDSNDFPGAEALSARATEICSDVRYSETLAERGDLGLQENKVIPTPASWNEGDRRIDCFVVAGADQELAESLLEQQ